MPVVRPASYWAVLNNYGKLFPTPLCGQRRQVGAQPARDIIPSNKIRQGGLAPPKYSGAKFPWLENRSQQKPKPLLHILCIAAACR